MPEGADAGTLKLVRTDEETIFKTFKLLLEKRKNTKRCLMLARGSQIFLKLEPMSLGLHERKAYLRREIFEDSEACKRVLEGYRAEELEAFDPTIDFQYFLTKLWQRIENIGINWKVLHPVADSYTAATDIIEYFKQWVENNKGWEVIVGADSRNREKIVQRVIHG